MRFSILVLILTSAISSAALAQGVGDAGSGNAGSHADYDYSHHFPGDLPFGSDRPSLNHAPARHPHRASHAGR